MTPSQAQPISKNKKETQSMYSCAAFTRGKCEEEGWVLCLPTAIVPGDGTQWSLSGAVRKGKNMDRYLTLPNKHSRSPRTKQVKRCE